MTVVDSAYASLVQGVSQQTPYQRRPGQMEEQLNMLSDPVYGLRRRPGAQGLSEFNVDALGTILASTTAELGVKYYHVIVHPGSLRVIPVLAPATEYVLDAPYLTGATRTDVMLTSMRGDLWVGNRKAMPAGIAPNSATLQNPTYTGFFFVRTGAFSKRYEVRITTDFGVAAWAYETPSGGGAGDVNASSPAAIALTLTGIINAGTAAHGYVATCVSAYVFLSTPVQTGMTITSPTGTSFVAVSGKMTVSAVDGLPAQLPAVADKCVCAVGTNTQTYQYYSWDSPNSTWQECGKYGSYTQYSNTPIRLICTSPGATPIVEVPVFSARLAGDDFTAPYSAITGDSGITGMFSYQGRLGFLSKEVVCMSSSTSPLLLGRSTVVDVIDSDYIEVFGGSLGGADFKSAVPFNKDLLLFADTHQAVMPAGSTVLTPRNAMLVLTGTSTCTSTCSPAQTGRWVQLAGPGASGYSALSTLQPSDYTAGQYFTTPSTEHLPQYFKGTPLQMAAAGASGFLCMLTTEGLYVQQHLWQGTQLSQLAWHEWKLPVQVSSIHIHADTLYLCLEQVDTEDNFVGVLAAIDWRKQDSTSVYLDGWTSQPVAQQPHLWQVQAGGVRCVSAASPVEETVGYWDGAVLTVSPAYLGSTYISGLEYESAFAPSPPVLLDNKERPVAMDQAKLVRTVGQFRNTGEFSVSVSGRPEYVVTPQVWAQAVLGGPQVAALSPVAVAVHSPAVQAVVRYSTKGARDLNLVHLEYTLKFAQRRKRV